MQGIYRIRNKLNGKYYIGSSVDAKSRWEGHCRQLKNSVHNHLLQPAWDKYGEENFEFEFIEKVENEDGLLSIEQKYLDEGFESNVLYNIARKAGGGGLSEETKRKIGKSVSEKWTPERRGELSEQKKEYWASEEHREEQSKRQRDSWTPERREDASKQTENSWTPERREKHSERMSDENHPRPWLGKHHTKETKAKLSKASAKPYPAFYNVKTGELIPAGKNLLNLCSELDLNYGSMWNIKKGVHKLTSDCWRLATEEEIFMN